MIIFGKEREEVEKYKKQTMEEGRGDNRKSKRNIVFELHHVQKLKETIISKTGTI